MTKKETLTALEIAKIACNIENDGSYFYEAAAEATADNKAKRLFKELADKEIEHLNAFRNMYKDLDDRIGLSPIEPAYLFDDSLTSYLKIISEGMIFPRGEEAKKWFSQPHDIKSIIKFSIETEKNTVLFFTEVLSHNAFFYSRKILENIIKAEKSYIVALSMMLKSMKNV